MSPIACWCNPCSRSCVVMCRTDLSECQSETTPSSSSMFTACRNNHGDLYITKMLYQAFLSTLKPSISALHTETAWCSAADWPPSAVVYWPVCLNIQCLSVFWWTLPCQNSNKCAIYFIKFHFNFTQSYHMNCSTTFSMTGQGKMKALHLRNVLQQSVYLNRMIFL